MVMRRDTDNSARDIVSDISDADKSVRDTGNSTRETNKSARDIYNSISFPDSQLPLKYKQYGVENNESDLMK